MVSFLIFEENKQEVSGKGYEGKIFYKFYTKLLLCHDYQKYNFKFRDGPIQQNHISLQKTVVTPNINSKE